MELAERTLFTDDVAAMTAFYRTLLGREPIVKDDVIAIFEEGQTTVLVHETYDPEEGELPPDDHVAYTVEDVDATFEELTDTGLAVFAEPDEYDWGRSGYLTDPDGRIVELRSE